MFLFPKSADHATSCLAALLLSRNAHGFPSAVRSPCDRGLCQFVGDWCYIPRQCISFFLKENSAPETETVVCCFHMATLRHVVPLSFA